MRRVCRSLQCLRSPYALLGDAFARAGHRIAAVDHVHLVGMLTKIHPKFANQNPGLQLVNRDFGYKLHSGRNVVCDSHSLAVVS